MFGPDAERIFNELPRLRRLTSRQARRTLSTIYLDLFSGNADATRETGPSTEWCASYIRRLANSLESYAVFDEDTPEELRAGAAFVAAEALSLLVEMTPYVEMEGCYYRLEHPRTYTVVEAALLYLIAGFDANAAVLMDLVPTQHIEENAALCTANAERALDTIFILCGKSRQLTGPGETTAAQLEAELDLAVRAGLFKGIGDSVWSYIQWRTGHNENGLGRANEQLRHLYGLLRAKSHGHCSIQHLIGLLIEVLDTTSSRATRNVPTPANVAEDLYREYLISRARGGENGTPRPLLWPSAVSFVRQCLPGPHSNAVVSIPTGSGKSFIAELALSQVLSAGWTIYLVPTNALANQVRGDLERAFKDYPGVEVRAFFGGEEYTTLANEDVSGLGAGVIAVMTPEKCALALRLSPAAFRNCQLCVFDECHVLVEGTRGVLAELVLSHLIALAADCRLLLMSALIENPNELAAWLTNVTGRETEVVDEPWRPTRSMRGVVALDKEQSQVNAMQSIRELRRLIAAGKKRKFNKFEAPHVVLASLQGPWTSQRRKEYALVRLPSTVSMKIDSEGHFDNDGWVNNSAAILTSYFGGRNLSVLTFLPTSKHYPFSVGQRVTLAPAVLASLNRNPVVEALLVISNDELGAQSAVADLIEKGIAVHTAALLDSEKLASEMAFQSGMAKVMMATGTLAQGLNLPTSVVLVAGTAVGDAREAQTVEGRMRSRSQLLNALGRAGRAGVSNHGVGLVITQEPVFVTNTFNPESITRRAEFLGQQENSTPITSRLEGFVRGVLSDELDILSGSAEDLVAFSYLPLEPQEGVSAAHILSRSYAFQRRPAADRAAEADEAATTLSELGASFIARTGCPEWIANVTYKTGLPFVFCLRLLQARARVLAEAEDELPTLQSYEQWARFLFRILRMLPPLRAQFVVGGKLTGSNILYLWEDLPVADSADWELPREWVRSWNRVRDFVLGYMRGETISTLAVPLLVLQPPIDPARSDGRKPIPKTLKFLRIVAENISRIAGAIACIEDEIASDEEDSSITALELDDRAKQILASLPLAIKNGFDSISGLQWYRFGIRYRRPAHLLGRLFPLPDELSSDEEAQTFVRRTMAQWIDGDLEPDGMTSEEEAVLDAVEVVVTR